MEESQAHGQWLRWMQRLQAIAQTGLAFARDPFDRERYTELRNVAAEIASTAAAESLPFVQGLFAQEVGYATPKIEVRGVVFHEGKLLLVRERSDGLWAIPGGYADVGQSAAENVVKEIYEEAELRTRAVKLLAILDRNKHGHPPLAFHCYKLFIRCELLDEPLVSGKAILTQETDGIGFFARDELPHLSTDRVMPHQIARMFEHHDNPRLPIDFD